jgi:hypothetical protein
MVAQFIIAEETSDIDTAGFAGVAEYRDRGAL